MTDTTDEQLAQALFRTLYDAGVSFNSGDLIPRLTATIRALGYEKREPVAVDDAMVERAAKALWVAENDDKTWAASVVDDCFSPADDWPDDALDAAERARAVLTAALTPDGQADQR